MGKDNSTESFSYSEYVDNYMDLYFDYYNVSFSLEMLYMYISFNTPEMVLLNNFSKILPYLKPTQACLSLIGNIIVLLVVLQRKNRKFSTPMYIASLAFADLISATSNGVLSSLILVGYSEAASPSTKVCKVYAFVDTLNNYMAVWSLSVVATERAISVLFPHKVKLICTTKSSRMVVFGLWTVGILVSSILTIDYGLNETDILGNMFKVCSYGEKFSKFIDESYPILKYIFTFVIPFFIIISSTVVILTALIAKPLGIKSEKSQVTSVTLTLLQVNVIFLITSGPLGILAMLKLSTGDQPSSDLKAQRKLVLYTLLTDIFSSLSLSNSILNVFVYFLNNPKFRKDFIKLFKCPKMMSVPKQTITTSMSNSVCKV